MKVEGAASATLCSHELCGTTYSSSCSGFPQVRIYRLNPKQDDVFRRSARWTIFNSQPSSHCAPERPSARARLWTREISSRLLHSEVTEGVFLVQSCEMYFLAIWWTHNPNRLTRSMWAQVPRSRWESEAAMTASRSSFCLVSRKGEPCRATTSLKTLRLNHSTNKNGSSSKLKLERQRSINLAA